MISLGAVELALASVLVIGLSVASYLQALGLGRQLVMASFRTVAQLLLVGLVLRRLFETTSLVWLGGVASFMLLVAAREVRARLARPLAGKWGYSVGALSMFVSSFSVTVLALLVVIRAEPWYSPQYAIPLLGMLLGNTMSGVALGVSYFTDTAYRERGAIEARLLLGHTGSAATSHLRVGAFRTGMVPILNSMAAAGVVSLPGMMTGQILAGSPPVEAAKYQILIMFLIAAGTGFGVMVSVWLSARRLIDDRERLRLDRLQ